MSNLLRIFLTFTFAIYRNDGLLIISETKNVNKIFISEPYTTIRKLIQGNAERAGVRIKGTHGLRHAAGTDSLQSSGDLRATQEILGHSTIKSTEKYTHIATERKRTVLDQMRIWRDKKRKAP